MTPRPLAFVAIAAILVVLSSCEPPGKPGATAPVGDATATEPAPEAPDLSRSVIRVHSTRQEWNAAQPWEKLPPARRRSLGAVVGHHQVLTTAEMVADATLIELETSDGLHLAPASVVAVDFAANLALLTVADEKDAGVLFAGLKPSDLAAPLPLDAQIAIVQVEDNGNTLVTAGNLLGVDVTAPYLPGEFFLAYRVKASMQTAASSFTLPVFSRGRFAGILNTYDSEDQVCEIMPSSVIQLFLEDAADGAYAGFPSLGVSVSTTDDPHFRRWLKLPDDGGGIYLSKIRKDGPAAKAGAKEGDVLMSIDGSEIDRLGYFDHPVFGRLFWSHLVKGSRPHGTEIRLGILRDGEAMEIKATLEHLDSDDELVPVHIHGRAPRYLVKGGFIFQELTIPLLSAFGDEWRDEAPLTLIDPLENPDLYRDRMDRVVVVTGVIPTPATLGYEALRNLIVTEVNGKAVRDMASLFSAFKEPQRNGSHQVRFDGQDFPIYLDAATSDLVDSELLNRGLTRLHRVE
jgi:S1-C subfamily serine protease